MNYPSNLVTALREAGFYCNEAAISYNEKDEKRGARMYAKAKEAIKKIDGGFWEVEE